MIIFFALAVRGSTDLRGGLFRRGWWLTGVYLFRNTALPESTA